MVTLLYAQPLLRASGRFGRVQRPQRHAARTPDRVGLRDHPRPLRRHRGLRSPRHDRDPIPSPGSAQATHRAQPASGAASPCPATSTTRTPPHSEAWRDTRVCSRPPGTWRVRPGLAPGRHGAHASLGDSRPPCVSSSPRAPAAGPACSGGTRRELDGEEPSIYGTLISPVGVRTHRLHRHRAVDRPDPRPVSGLPHQPGLRPQGAGLAQGPQAGPDRAVRRGDPSGAARVRPGAGLPLLSCSVSRTRAKRSGISGYDSLARSDDTAKRRSHT